MYSKRDDHIRGGTYFVLDGDLCLAIRPGPLENALFPAVVEPLDQFLGIDVGEGHGLRGFIAGIADHQPLVPCPYFLCLLFLGVECLEYFGGLLV